MAVRFERNEMERVLPRYNEVSQSSETVNVIARHFHLSRPLTRGRHARADYDAPHLTHCVWTRASRHLYPITDDLEPDIRWELDVMLTLMKNIRFEPTINIFEPAMCVVLVGISVYLW